VARKPPTAGCFTPAAATLGIASTFVRAGFVEAGWPWPGKVLMRRKL